VTRHNKRYSTEKFKTISQVDSVLSIHFDSIKTKDIMTDNYFVIENDTFYIYCEKKKLKFKDGM
jgi:hypothetical protein